MPGRERGSDRIHFQQRRLPRRVPKSRNFRAATLPDQLPNGIPTHRQQRGAKRSASPRARDRVDPVLRAARQTRKLTRPRARAASWQAVGRAVRRGRRHRCGFPRFHASSSGGRICRCSWKIVTQAFQPVSELVHRLESLCHSPRSVRPSRWQISRVAVDWLSV